jgi:DNA-binding NtrC family response regulator
VRQPASYECRALSRGVEAARLLQSGQNFNLLISDVLNSPLDGLTLLQCAKRDYPNLAVMIATSSGDLSLAVDCIRNDADEYISFPAERERVLTDVGHALRRETRLQRAGTNDATPAYPLDDWLRREINQNQ